MSSVGFVFILSRFINPM